MVWIDDTAGTGVASINNSDGNISVSNPTGTVTLDLSTSIAVENITIGLAPNNYTMPSTIGTNGQILGINGSTIAWIDDTEGGFTVEGTTNEITANTVGNTCTLSLPNTVAINTLTLNSKTFQNPATGNPTQILGLDSSNNMVWIDDTEGGFTVEGTDNQITANTVGNTCTLSLPLGVEFPGEVSILNNVLNTLDINNENGSVITDTLQVYTDFRLYGCEFGNTNDGSQGQLLSIDTSTQPYNMKWIDPPGVLSIVNNDNNIIVSDPSGNITLNLNTSIDVESIGIGISPSNYYLPTSPGTVGQVMTVSNGNVEWINGASVVGNAGNITVNLDASNNQYAVSISDPATVGEFNCDIISVGTEIIYDNITMESPNGATVGDVLTIQLNNSNDPYMSWVPFTNQSSFNFQFLDNGGNPNVIGFGSTTLYNVGGVTTGIFPFDALLSNNKQYYIPAYSSAIFTCSTFLPVGYRPSRNVVYQITVSQVTLDVNQNPNSVVQVYPMQLNISSSGVISFSIYIYDVPSSTYILTPFVAGTPYMFNTYTFYNSNAFVFQLL